MTKYVYSFGDGKADGTGEMKNLLGGKGANLAEMNLIGVPVPPGFTITTEVCTIYNSEGKEKALELIKKQVEEAIAEIEQITNTEFGSKENPCLVSVRSGARASMPGMMDTVLNLGLNDEAVEGIAKKSGNPEFAWDSYRRFIQMYADVVMEMGEHSKEEQDPFERILHDMKVAKGVQLDNELKEQDLRELVSQFKEAVRKATGTSFPTDPWEQLWGSVCAVFNSWMNERAVLYRKHNKIPVEWGTAVNVQAMVFGNMGNDSATGVAFTRNAATGEDVFNGEYLVNAQGEDVVAGIRTPQQVTIRGSKEWAKFASVNEEDRATKFPSLEERMPEMYQELSALETKLENHYKDMQDIEFTIQEGKLWILQTRNGKRTGEAMTRIAMELLEQGMINEKEALLMIDPNKLDELLHPVFDQNEAKNSTLIAQGLPASPGAASGQICFFADDAEQWVESNKAKDVILVRVETSPEDLKGMYAAQGILTARGGMTSHAAVVARGMGKCCVSGAGALQIDYKSRTVTVDGKVYKEGDWLSLNGSTGEVFEGKIPTIAAELSGDFGKLMELADKHRTMKVRTNADSPDDAQVAKKFGAQGIGLCRTEHMFFEGERIKAMRKMILSTTEERRQAALLELLPYQKDDFEGIFDAMSGMGVTIRLLDPPLHEFVPHQNATQKELAEEMQLSLHDVMNTIHDLEEFNPMLGHRGCRLGITYPEITRMQARAIIEGAIASKAKGNDPRPEIMVPLVGTPEELKNQTELIHKVAKQVMDEKGVQIDYLVGTMIEVPRAALLAEEIAQYADFFSFGTNDLTQMTFGYSRDDSGKFLQAYTDNQILKNDPFEVLDQKGVGQLVTLAAEKGRTAKSQLKLGICGEHGGEPSSVEFCHRTGLDYVSCSPFRVPIARVAAAIAAVREA